MAVLGIYTETHGPQIRSEEYALRVKDLVRDYLAAHKLTKETAAVVIWTPSRQLDFAQWLNTTFGHAPSTIARTFAVMSAAFKDAAKVKMRMDVFGRQIEGALMSHSPDFKWNEVKLRKALQLPAKETETFVPTLDEMARFVDALQTEHLKRWALLALATWARPEAVTDFDPYTQWDRRTNVINLDVKGRVETTKRRARIVCCRTLAGMLDKWMVPRTFDDPRLPPLTLQTPAAADLQAGQGREREDGGSPDRGRSRAA